MTTAEVYSALARVVLVNRGLDDVLTEVVQIARDALPGAEQTSITLMRGDRAWTAAYAGRLAYEADELQYATGHGPCMDAGRTGLMLVANDLATETRWPGYTPRVVGELGLHSSMSAPLPFQGSTIGGLNVYSSSAGSFTDESVAAAEAVAAHVAVAVMNADAHAEAMAQAENLKRALESRKVIDMALGILMSTHHCSADEAFAILSKASQNRNKKLRELAAGLVESTVGQGVR
ncbi:ANTAR domain-containing protein [Pedococcus sp. 2YAF34]|uniref:ANTAR domain-containing protein n=1 Tax=Pedococcus sp. 2YAF34 TaxID=3233032 RepID=UPI003F9DB806